MPAIRHTPLTRRYEQAGIGLVDHHGWLVPVHFGSAQREAEQVATGVVLSDVSWMVRLDLKGFGLKTTPVLQNGRMWNFGTQHYLATCDPAARESVTNQLKSLAAPPQLMLPSPVYMTDVTSVYAQFLLAGPRSAAVLRKLTSLNVGALENLACGQAGVAHVHGTVLREDFADNLAFHVLVSREYGESVWDAIMHAGHEFGIGMMGLEAHFAARGGRV